MVSKCYGNTCSVVNWTGGPHTIGIHSSYWWWFTNMFTPMKYRYLLLPAALFSFFTTIAQKDTCKVGIYISSIYDFKLDEKSYMADFWMWINYKNDSLKFENNVEIPNSKSVDFNHYSLEKKGDWNWASQKCRAQLIHQWDVSKFPFDKQVLRIEIEDSEYDTSRVVYKADEVNSKIDTSFNSKEWCIERFSLKETVKTYQTTYGNPGLSGESSYPRLVAEITIRRNNSWVKLMKMLTGAYIAFFISCLAFFISSENQDSRFALIVGGVFAAIGNKYIVESIVPSSTTTTLMDNVHNLTLFFILLICIVVTVSLYLFESGDERDKKLSFKIDKVSFYAFVVIYIIINCYLTWLAARGY